MLPVCTEIAMAAHVPGAACAGAAPMTMAPVATATVAARVVVERMRLMVGPSVGSLLSEGTTGRGCDRLGATGRR